MHLTDPHEKVARLVRSNQNIRALEAAFALSLQSPNKDGYIFASSESQKIDGRGLMAIIKEMTDNGEMESSAIIGESQLDAAYKKAMGIKQDTL